MQVTERQPERGAARGNQREIENRAHFGFAAGAEFAHVEIGHSAQYTASHPGEVCPAKWKEGAKTIAPSLELVGKI